jgi:hypothetical protein
VTDWPPTQHNPTQPTPGRELSLLVKKAQVHSSRRFVKEIPNCTHFGMPMLLRERDLLLLGFFKHPAQYKMTEILHPFTSKRTVMKD